MKVREKKQIENIENKSKGILNSLVDINKSYKLKVIKKKESNKLWII